MKKENKLSKTLVTKTLFANITNAQGRTCPRCGSTNTDQQNGIWYCYDCQKEF